MHELYAPFSAHLNVKGSMLTMLLLMISQHQIQFSTSPSPASFLFQTDINTRGLAATNTSSSAMALVYAIDDPTSAKICSFSAVNFTDATGTFNAVNFAKQDPSPSIKYSGSPDIFATNKGLLCKPFKSSCKDHTKTFTLSNTTSGDPINAFCLQIYSKCAGGGNRTSLDITANNGKVTREFKVSCRVAREKAGMCVVSNAPIKTVTLKANYKNYRIEVIEMGSSCGAPIVGL
jgi:hypothetical protein